jgi:hypothetical protein
MGCTRCDSHTTLQGTPVTMSLEVVRSTTTAPCGLGFGLAVSQALGVIVTSNCMDNSLSVYVA